VAFAEKRINGEMKKEDVYNKIFCVYAYYAYLQKKQKMEKGLSVGNKLVVGVGIEVLGEHMGLPKFSSLALDPLFSSIFEKIVDWVKDDIVGEFSFSECESKNAITIVKLLKII